MRGPFPLVLAAVFLSTTIPTAAAESDLTFGSPGWLEGSVEVGDAVYAVLFFGESASAHVEFSASQAVGFNHSATQGSWDGDRYPYVPTTTARESFGAIRLAAEARPGSSLMVMGTILAADWSAESTQVVPLGGACGEGRFTAADRDGSRQRFLQCPEGDMPVLYHGDLTGGGLAPLRLLVADVRVVEWEGLEVSCQSAACPSGAGEGAEHSLPPPADVRVRTFHQQEVRPTDGRLLVEGAASAFLVGGRALDVSLDGAMRLPTASGAPGCKGCIGPENQTLFVAGQVGLDGLRTASGGRFAATMGGAPASVQFDEDPVDPVAFLGSPAGLAAGVAAATAAVGVALKALLGGLFTRLSKEKALEHPRRSQLYHYIQEHPGANFREVVRNSGIASGTTRHHLSVLKRSGHIVEKAHGGTVRFFENHGKYEATWGNVVLLREEPLRQLHEWLRAHPNVSQKSVLEGMERIGWSRSTTQHRLVRLQQGGLVLLRQQGRLKFYNVSGSEPHDAPPLRIAPAVAARAAGSA